MIAAITPIITPIIVPDGGGPSGPLPWWGYLIFGTLAIWFAIFLAVMTYDVRGMSYDWTDRIMEGLLWFATACVAITGIICLIIPIWGFIT